MRRSIFTFLVLWLSVFDVPMAIGADWYVSTSGNNADGTSWASAWDEFDQVDWGDISAGDTVVIDGGATGTTTTYSTNMTIITSGTSENRITIERSKASGHDGSVIMLSSQIYVNSPYITIDGKDSDKFWVYYPDISGMVVNVAEAADYFEFRNIYVSGDGDFDLSNWGSLFRSYCEHILISNCKFGLTNGEDQLKYTHPGGYVVIEDSYFYGLINHDGYHCDALEVSSQEGVNVTARRNIFDQPTDQFMMKSDGEQTMGVLDFSYNVFLQVGDAIKFHTCAELILHNNTFYGGREIVTYAPLPSVSSRNNLYTGLNQYGNAVHQSPDPQYCLWDVDTEEFVIGTGNIQAGPLFVDKDGHDVRVQVGSPAINAGTSLGYTVDVLGNPIVGLPDIGAYEYQGTPTVLFYLHDGSLKFRYWEP